MSVRVRELAPRSDPRGDSFGVELPFNDIRECHVATIRPGAIRGNHFHTDRREILVVMYADRWTLFWDEGEGTPVHTRSYTGSGAVVLEADPLSAHAVRNDGARDLHIVSLGDVAQAATLPRRIAEPRPRLAGLDGCRSGWVAVVQDRGVDVRIVPTEEELVRLAAECAVVAIDIPIGLAERGARACDTAARRFLGGRASSVFPAPLRPLVHLRDTRRPIAPRARCRGKGSASRAS